MLKNKGVMYIIVVSLVLLGGLSLMFSKKDTSTSIETETETHHDVGMSNPTPLPTGEKLSFKKAVGEEAPDFSLESISGETITLSDYRGKMVVLFFNEGSMCYPACWNQIQEFTQDARFNKDDVEVFSLVIDSKKQWERIVSETQGFAGAQILFDTTRAVSVSYDVLSLTSSMHPGTIPGHTYFVIDTEGIIRYAFDDPNMAIRNDLIFSELSIIKGE